MNEDTHRALIAVATGVAGFCVGSVLTNRVKNREIRRRGALEVNTFRTIASALCDPKLTPQEAVGVMTEEIEFLMIALNEG